MEGASCLQMGRVWQRHREGVDPFREESPSQVGRGLCKGWDPVPYSEPLDLDLLGLSQVPRALPHPCLTPALLQLPPGWTLGSCLILAANSNF